MWTLKEGVDIVRLVQSVAEHHGANAGLIGGVILKGSSAKDLDIVIYPHDSTKGYNPYAIQVGLGDNFFRWMQCLARLNYPRDDKEVWTAETINGKRVDFFFLMSERSTPKEL